ncbi:palmitoyl-(protein) hydrolase [Rhizophagus irregularis DAOM 197198w]|uniref:Acyl-protein thioesterase 1 n=1 Tax=Rhizophagus irregularis (strain DAOM 197198w) TaxID=1432141 RepID=A0A015KBG9_RHIIW|nr:palmitoyl-(protein) hydrolase [Rhizophagus irregularis DAOM 197198w]
MSNSFFQTRNSAFRFLYLIPFFLSLTVLCYLISPIRPVAVNGGARMRAWYDIYALSNAEDILKQRLDDEGVLLSVASVNRLIRDEIDAGIPSNRIVIGGFSQGAAVGITIGLLSEYPFAGIIGLSGYVPLKEKTFTMATDANKNTPIFLGHGDCDEILPYQIGKLSYELIKSRGYPVTFKTYNGMGHHTSQKEIKDMISFLQEVIPDQNSEKI